MKKLIGGFARFMQQSGKLIAASIIGVVIGGLGLAAVRAAVPDAGSVYHACYLNSTGAMRIIDTASQSCAGNETAISWNMATPGKFINNLAGADFTNADVRYRDFSFVDLNSAVFNGTNTTGSYFRGANLTNTFFNGNNLANSDFSSMTLTYTYFGGSNLDNANFSNSTLDHVSISSSTTNATNFSNTVIDGADLRYSDLSNADFSNATWISVLCPDNTNSDDNGNTCIGHLVQ